MQDFVGKTWLVLCYVFCFRLRTHAYSIEYNMHKKIPHRYRWGIGSKSENQSGYIASANSIRL